MMGGEKQKFVNVFSVVEPNHLRFLIYQETTAEDIILECCKSLNIGPVARHLFALRFHCEKEFVSPGVRLLECNKNDFDFRLRFKLPSVNKVPPYKRLGSIDSRAHYFYFNQVKTDIMDNKIPDISYSKNKDQLVGLGVVDMYRAMLEQGVSRNEVENDYKKFIPKEVLRRHITLFVKKPVHKCLSEIIDSDIHTTVGVINAYLQQFEDMAPNYLTEEYKAVMDDGETLWNVVIKVDPLNRKFPGVSFCYDGKTEWNHLCTIEEFCYISVKSDGTTEISRKSGIPIYLRFDSILIMASFISLLDGYYRLSVKWTFNLCKNLPTPSLERLYAMKCHGPVGGYFSYAKLEEKRNNKPGCYILRESETTYDVYYLDVCTNFSTKPTTYKIAKMSENNYLFGEDTIFCKSYESVKKLIMALSAENSPILLQECLPPSEFDQSPLLLCKVDDSDGSSGISGSGSCIDDGEPRCINTNQLLVYKAHKTENPGEKTYTYRGVLRRKNKKIDVAISVLKPKYCESNLSDLFELAGKWAMLNSPAVSKLYGITLMSPVSVVTEYFHLGPLDVYLREHKNSIKEVDLVEAATYLATAVWHLEEAGIVHGNIRCHKLLVAAHTDNSFSVRLSDPGLCISYNENDIHWIPAEWHRSGSMEGARKSIAADMWALGTTLWELFSYGQSPVAEVRETPIQYYGEGKRLPKPAACSPDIYNLMWSCWDEDPYRRKKPQEAMRDINQILYQVFNSRRAHSYSTVHNGATNDAIANNNDNISLAYDDLRSINTTDTTLSGLDFIKWMGTTGGGLVDTTTLLLPKSCSIVTDTSSLSMSSFSIGFLPAIDKPTDNPTSTTSIDSMTSLQGIFELDDYNIILKGRIGQGYYGEVYKGSMEQLVQIDKDAEPQLVAVKKLKSGSITSNSLNDFHREISIMKRLKHPNIVEIKGVIQEPEISLVMEYVQHGSLQCYLNIHRDKLDPYQNLLKFADDVAKGMEYLGSENIVHRDLAARNILVASESQVKISDFGLAQVMDSDDYYMVRTSRELPVKWYAPESLENGKFSTRSDVWSYGVTLYEMFSYGEDPCLPELKGCSELDQAKLLEALKKGARLPCPSSCPLKIYTDIISSCWKYDSRNRISFSEVQKIIKDIQNNSLNHYVQVSA